MKFIKLVTKALISLLIAAVLLWIVLLVILQTKPGQKWILKKASIYFEEATKTDVKVKRFSFAFPLDLGIEGITFIKEGRTIGTIKKLELRCAYAALLQGRVVISQLRVDEVNLIELPLAYDSATSDPSLSWDKPLFPFYIKIEEINAQKIKINPRLADRFHIPPEGESLLANSSFNLSGYINHTPFQSSLTAHLQINARNEATDTPLFRLGINAKDSRLSLSFHAGKIPSQIIPSSLPPSTTGHIALRATGLISSWQALATRTLGQDDPIQGHFKLILENVSDDDGSFISTLLTPKTLLKGNYSLYSAKEIEISNFKLENQKGSLAGAATLNSDFVIQQGYFQGVIHSLSQFEKRVNGSLSFKGEVSGPLSSPAVTLHLTTPALNIEALAFKNFKSTLHAVLSKEKLEGEISLACEYPHLPWEGSTSFVWIIPTKEVALSELKITSQGLRLEGDGAGSLSSLHWSGEAKVEIEDLSKTFPSTAVEVGGKGLLDFQFVTTPEKRLAAQGKLLGTNLKWGGAGAKEINLNFSLIPSVEKTNLARIQGKLEGRELKDQERALAYCTLDFSHDLDIANYRLTHLVLKGEGEDLIWGDAKISKIEGTSLFEDPAKTLDGEVNFTASNIRFKEIEMETLKGTSTLTQSEAPWPFQLEGAGSWKHKVAFNLNGTWHHKEDLLTIETENLSGQFGPFAFNLKKPFSFYRSLDDIQLDHLSLQLGEGELEGDFKIQDNSLSAKFSTNELPSKLFNLAFADIPLKGMATLKGEVGGTLKEPTGNLQIDLHEIQIIEDVFAQKPFIEGSILLNLDEKGVQLQSKLTGIGETPLLITGDLPYHLQLEPLSFEIDPALPFHLKLDAEGELDPYLHLFYNDTTNISGQTKIALELTGSIDSPKINGSIDLVDGTYESLSTGTLYNNIQAHLEGDGSKVTLTQLSAENGKNGKITATGEIAIDAANQFPFAFEITPSHIFIMDSDYIDVEATGVLHLAGNTKKSRLEGRLTIDQANIHLEETLPRNIKKIDVQYLNVPEEDLPHFQKIEKKSPIELNVTLTAPQVIKVEGKNLKSEWTGSLVATGTPSNLQLNGDIRLAQGEFDFNGKVFNLTQGNVHFGGNLDKKTTLYVVASKDIDRIKAEIIVKGLITQPVISFRSTPPLSQREILSYILFNTGISDITQDQGDQLSQSFISLNSSDQTASSDDFLSRLRNKVGIDRLDFTTSDDPNSKNVGLQVGKNITENISISVNQGMVSLAPIIAVEAKLHKDIKAQAEGGIGQNTPIRMSIKWKKDY